MYAFSAEKSGNFANNYYADNDIIIPAPQNAPQNLLVSLCNKGYDPVQLIYQHPEKVMNPKWKMHEVLEESWEVPDDLL